MYETVYIDMGGIDHDTRSTIIHKLQQRGVDCRYSGNVIDKAVWAIRREPTEARLMWSADPQVDMLIGLLLLGEER